MILASSYSDLMALSVAIRSLPALHRRLFIALIYSTGLMKAGWAFRAAIWLIRWRVSTDAQAWYLLMNNNKSGEIEKLMTESFFEHLRNGKDTTDPTSAGGFNQVEIAKIILCFGAAEKYGDKLEELE